jgi:hypothetical protein
VKKGLIRLRIKVPINVIQTGYDTVLLKTPINAVLLLMFMQTPINSHPFTETDMPIFGNCSFGKANMRLRCELQRTSICV